MLLGYFSEMIESFTFCFKRLSRQYLREMKMIAISQRTITTLIIQKSTMLLYGPYTPGTSLSPSPSCASIAKLYSDLEYIVCVSTNEISTLVSSGSM